MGVLSSEKETVLGALQLQLFGQRRWPLACTPLIHALCLNFQMIYVSVISLANEVPLEKAALQAL